MDENIIILEEETENIEEIEIVESEPIVINGTNIKHSALQDKDEADQHLITSITGLKEKLDLIESLKTVYSDNRQQADYYKWQNESEIPEVPYGLFVSLYTYIPNEETGVRCGTGNIQICDDVTDVFGVTVESAGFVGNQAYDNDEKRGRDNKYNLVAQSGVVAVQKHTNVSVGDYVVPSAFGKAKKVETGKYGYLVTGLSNMYGVDCAIISLSAPITTAKHLSRTLYGETDASYSYAEGLVSRMSKTEQNISNLTTSLKEFKNPDGKELANKEDLDKLGTEVEAAKKEASAAKTYASEVSKEAVDRADEAITAIEQIGESVKTLTYEIAPYSIGEYSQAYGLSYQQAKEAIEIDKQIGCVHIPTVDHQEMYDGYDDVHKDSSDIPSNIQVFTKRCYYTWNGEQWISSNVGGVVFSLNEYLTSETTPYWVVEADITSEDGKVYHKGEVWYWNNGEQALVTTVDQNGFARTVNYIYKAINETSIEVTNAKGDVAALQTELNKEGATTSMISSLVVDKVAGTPNNPFPYPKTEEELKNDDTIEKNMEGYYCVGNQAPYSVYKWYGEDGFKKIINITYDGIDFCKINTANIIAGVNAEDGESFVGIDANKIKFNGEAINISAKNINFDDVEDLTISATKINFEDASNLRVSAENVDFISKAFDIYPSDGNGNKTSDEPNFSVDEYGNVDITGKISATELYIGPYGRNVYSNELIANGKGEYGDNTNFSAFTYEKDENNIPYFSINTKETATHDEFIKINDNTKYLVSFDGKEKEDVFSLNYGAMVCYDADKKDIISKYGDYYAGHTYTLAQDFSEGDVEIVFTEDISNLYCYPDNIAPDQEKTHNGFLFWGYTNSKGYTYPDGTYSRNLVEIIYDASFFKTSDTEFDKTKKYYIMSNDDYVLYTGSSFKADVDYYELRENYCNITYLDDVDETEQYYTYNEDNDTFVRVEPDQDESEEPEDSSNTGFDLYCRDENDNICHLFIPATGNYIKNSVEVPEGTWHINMEVNGEADIYYTNGNGEVLNRKLLYNQSNNRISAYSNGSAVFLFDLNGNQINSTNILDNDDGFIIAGYNADSNLYYVATSYNSNYFETTEIGLSDGKLDLSSIDYIVFYTQSYATQSSAVLTLKKTTLEEGVTYYVRRPLDSTWTEANLKLPYFIRSKIKGNKLDLNGANITYHNSSKKNFKVGENCSQKRDGVSYKIINGAYGTDWSHDEWQHFEQAFFGFSSSGSSWEQNKFPQGTEFVKLIFWSDSAIEHNEIAIKNVSFKIAEDISLFSEFEVTDDYIKLKTQDLVIDSNSLKLNWDGDNYSDGALEINTTPLKLKDDTNSGYSLEINTTPLKLTKDNETSRYSLEIDTNYFKVFDDGKMSATSGDIGGFNITDTAIQSEDYIENKPVIWNEDMQNERIVYGTLEYAYDTSGFYRIRGLDTDVAKTTVTDVIIPSTYNNLPVRIGEDAFLGYTALKNVTFQTPVTSGIIESHAFNGCKSLKNIILPKEIKQLRANAFANSGLTDVTLDNIKYIGDGAFYNCQNLTTIIIPNSVTQIGTGVFELCSNLTIYCEQGEKPEMWSEYWDAKRTDEYHTVYWYSQDEPTVAGNYWRYSNLNGFKISPKDKQMIDSKYFKVSSDGIITATNARIEGELKANSISSMCVETTDGADKLISSGSVEATTEGFDIKCSVGTGRLIGAWTAESLTIARYEEIIQSLEARIKALEDK